MAGPLSLEELARKAIYTVSFHMLFGSPSALPEYFEEEALKRVLVPVRKMLLEELNLMVTKVAVSEGPPMDYCTILEGILDDHIDSLQIISPLPCRSSFSKLMSVIAHRCPNLRNLDIIFYNNNSGIMLAVTPALISHLMSYLNQLYSLRLSSNTSQELVPLESLLSIIGQTCPKLKKLDILACSYIEPEKRCILALLVGEDLARALFPQVDEGWAEDSVLCKLRMPTMYLNPLCFTLETMIPLYVRHYGSVYAFLLRHLPKFKSWSCNGIDEIPVGLIKALHRAEEKPLHADQQAAFEEDCRASAAALNLDITSSSTLLSGPLPIQRIANVRIKHLNALAAVGRMCPQLESICFEDVDKPRDNLDDYLSTDVISVYRTLFNRWSTTHKLSCLTLKGLNPDFVSIVLNTFGSSVKHLTLKGCRGINLTDLWQCTELENLFIKKSTINSETSDPTTRTSNTFLPSLIKVKCCSLSLPDWSAWLQSKSGVVWK